MKPRSGRAAARSRCPSRATRSAHSKAGRSFARDDAALPTIDRLKDPAARRNEFLTSYGAPLDATYSDDAQRRDSARSPSLPGEPPFTRGIQPTMYRGRLWTMRQYAGFGSADDTNARFRSLLEHGQTGLSVAFDLPTQMGYDPDDPRVAGEVGKVGVSIATVDDMARLFARIPLADVTTSMTINATAPILLALYVATGEAQGVAARALGGTTQNDILKEYIARGTYIFPPRPSMRLATDLIEYAAENLPRWNPISISGYHIREAGSTSVQELAFTFANAIAYVDSAKHRGMSVERFAPQLSFFFAAHSTFIEEVAKFRAARKIWARLMSDRYGVTDPAALALRFHTQTMGSTLTAQQPLNNIVRTAIEALAAVLGGTQSLHTNAYDEALALPTEEAARIALRTQQIIAEETGVADTVDPLGGSYAIESLTTDIERRVHEEVAKIDEMGGALAAIEAGYPMREIEESAYRQQRAVESGEQIVVGVNAYRGEADDAATPILRVDERMAAEQAERVRAFRGARDAAAASRARTDLITAARGTSNLVPAILAAVRAKVTLGEICADLRGVFGTYEPDRP
ncbi:MAG TPA: methylmalonyl-CoA mutase family protein [Candidatus Limnocylindrales bacterium]|nr:methylmalonyl-CoA mutase family protein [Candidatus Limnocylindrales bacterium]